MDKKLQSIFSSFNGDKNELIPVLQGIQEEFGYLPTDAMRKSAEFLHIPESRIYAVATFYAQFRFTPRGKKHIMVCRGTACHVKGVSRILDEIERELDIKEGGTTNDGEYSLESVACIGACSLSPCIMIDKDVAAKLTPKKIRTLFKRGGE